MNDHPVICPRCHRPAPHLITWRQANQAAPLVECPRCAYPTNRYLGAPVETMPAADLAWYTAHAEQGRRAGADTDTATCIECGSTLLFHRPERDRCARCHPATEWWGHVPAALVAVAVTEVTVSTVPRPLVHDRTTETVANPPQVRGARRAALAAEGGLFATMDDHAWDESPDVAA